MILYRRKTRKSLLNSGFFRKRCGLAVIARFPWRSCLSNVNENHGDPVGAGAADVRSSASGIWLSRLGVPMWLALFVAAADQLTKYFVVRAWPVGADPYVVIPGVFHLVHWRNSGAAWGKFQDHTGLLALLSVAVLAFLIWHFPALAAGFRERAFALGLMSGGIAGNLVDRIARGEVVDFLFFFYRSFQWPAFNLADSAISCGVLLYILSTLFRRHATAEDHA